MNDTKVSALVSAYYADEFLDGRIQNLLEQTLVPEIIIVCQVDSKEEKVATEYLRKVGDKIIIVSTLDVPTVYAAWNLAIAASHGEYLTNANCDDRASLTLYEKLAAVLDSKLNCGVAYSDIAIVEKIGGPVTQTFRWAEGGLRQLLEGCFLGPMPMWRRSLHEEYGMFDPAFHSAGDYEFWLRLAANGVKFFHVKEILGSYLLRKSSVEHRTPMRATWETARARAKYRML